MSPNISSDITNSLQVSFNKPYHQLTREKTFSNINTYRKFLNWISGEFDLNLQDESDNLKVFFPYKKLSVSKLNLHNRNGISAEINVEAVALHDGFQLLNLVESIYQNLMKMAY